MRFATHILGIAIIIIGLAVSVGTADEKKKTIKPTQRWGGIVNDEGKQKAAPKAGFLTSQDAFDNLWKAWGLKDKAPNIDFSKQFVFVQIASGPNNLSTTYKLDAKGDLTALSAQTLKAGPGFGYGIDVLPSEGIKSYQGKAIAGTPDKK